MTRPRSCGDCRACCVVLAIDALAKPACQVCPNGGAPCTAYETRPADCRDYACEWLLEPRLPRAWRPDRLGVIFDRAQATGVAGELVARLDAAGVPLLHAREVWPGAFNRRLAKRALDVARETGAVLVHPWSAK